MRRGAPHLGAKRRHCHGRGAGRTAADAGGTGTVRRRRTSLLSTSTRCTPDSTSAGADRSAVRASGPEREQPPRQGRPFGPTKEGPVRASG
ncbi:hypothetical protein, partial [Streptomyces sp. NPDC059828]|uniref:hypothetical protein n=1 Tax=Streptomyces sp. NPDC059828 TaxID=3346965 RepID=UPI0036693DC5